MFCRVTGKIVDEQACNACWGNIQDGNGGFWHGFCKEQNLKGCITILEHLWETDRQAVLRLVSQGLLSETTAKSLLNVELPKVELPNEYEQLMRHDSYKRISGALRQVMWG